MIKNNGVSKTKSIWRPTRLSSGDGCSMSARPDDIAKPTRQVQLLRTSTGHPRTADVIVVELVIGSLTSRLLICRDLLRCLGVLTPTFFLQCQCARSTSIARLHHTHTIRGRKVTSPRHQTAQQLGTARLYARAPRCPELWLTLPPARFANRSSWTSSARHRTLETWG